LAMEPLLLLGADREAEATVAGRGYESRRAWPIIW
jgi:hypothetical protein